MLAYGPKIKTIKRRQRGLQVGLPKTQVKVQGPNRDSKLWTVEKTTTLSKWEQLQSWDHEVETKEWRTGKNHMPKEWENQPAASGHFINQQTRSGHEFLKTRKR